MPAGGYSEDALVEQPTMALLAELGWETLNGYDEHPSSGGPIGRSSFTEAVLPERLRLGLRSVNVGLSDAALDQAAATLTRDRSAMPPVRANHEIWQLLREGFPAAVTGPDGTERIERVQYIHWTASDRNDLLAVNQFWITGPLHRRRCDVVLFVNGIPLVLLELKASHKKVEDGYRQNIRDYRDTIPQLFWNNGFILVSNGSEARVGASFASWDHFTEWKKVDSESESGRIALETTVRATCRPDRVLDLVENFTVFQEQPGGLVKKFAKNHQYLGVNNALEGLQRLGDEVSRLGVFWHTQGSGKSLSMIFFTQKVLRKLPGGWTFVVVTDRRELDRQLYGEFQSAGAIAGGEVQATSSSHLRELLAADHRFVFTLIHKFRAAAPDEPMDVLSDRRNVIVITDEAHRSQYAQLALNMRTALPNAAFLGFTGTPLIAGEVQRTREVFGEYVSVYSWSDAQADQVAVPLYYENRTPEMQIINEKFAEEFADLLEDAATDGSEDDDSTETLLAHRFATEYQLITRPERLRTIAADLVEHLVERGFDGKAMYVALDKATAVHMHDLVSAAWEEHLAELETRVTTAAPFDRPWLEGRIAFMRTTDMAVVVSQSQNEIADLDARGLDIRPHRKRMNEEDLETRFKDPEDAFRLVFVCAMWMTGFDVPSCSTIYLDRPMRNHTLMQTIARANRVFPEKENGLIVDYVGVFRNIESALAVYGARPGDVASQERPIEDKDELLAALDDMVEECSDLCDRCDVDLDALAAAEGFAFIQLRDFAVEALLVDPDQKRDFLTLADRCRALLKAVMPDLAANRHLKQVGLYRNLAEKIRGHVVVPDLSGLADAVDELLDRSIGAEAYMIQTSGDAELSRFVDLGLISFDRLRELYGDRKHTAADRLAHLLRHRSAGSATRNPSRVEFVRRIEELIAEYNTGSLNIDEYLRRLIRLTRELDEDEQRVVVEELTEPQLAVFDLLTRPGPDLTDEERESVKVIAKRLLDTITDKLVLDWRKRQRSRSAVRVAVGQALDNLPEVYDDDLFEEKRNVVFDHLLTSFFDDGSSVYAQPVGSLPRHRPDRGATPQR
ncbi:MAG: type I restriction endonuclease subunit R [Actinomycetota bacterium]|nr:type I restriction endonuclease subunit R [Actinomycetota bacterium]